MSSAWSYVAGGYGATAAIVGAYAVWVVRRRRVLARSAPARHAPRGQA